jgi:hypothetical protein
MVCRGYIIYWAFSTATATATRATFGVGLHGRFACVCQIDFEALWFRIIVAWHNRLDVVEIVVQAWRNRLG